jgi:hypothetical protein
VVLVVKERSSPVWKFDAWWFVGFMAVTAKKIIGREAATNNTWF